jgi:hypothetical protein
MEALESHNGAQERVCVFITAVPIIKAVRVGEGHQNTGWCSQTPVDRRNAPPESLQFPPKFRTRSCSSKARCIIKLVLLQRL